MLRRDEFQKYDRTLLTLFLTLTTAYLEGRVSLRGREASSEPIPGAKEELLEEWAGADPGGLKLPEAR